MEESKEMPNPYQEDKSHGTLEQIALRTYEYGQLRMEYFQQIIAEKVLGSSDKAGGAIAAIISYVILAVLLTNFLLFSLIFLGILFSKLLGSLVMGFGALLLLLLSVIIVFLMIKKWVIKKPISKAIANTAAQAVNLDHTQYGNRKLALELEKKRLNLEMQEYEVLKEFQELKMNYHPAKLFNQLSNTGFVQENQQLAEKVESFANDEQFLSKFQNFQRFTGDLMVYMSSHFATNQMSKSLHKRRRKYRERPKKRK